MNSHLLVPLFCHSTTWSLARFSVSEFHVAVLSVIPSLVDVSHIVKGWFMHGCCIYILHENSEPEHFYTLSDILGGKYFFIQLVLRVQMPF
jgi:hypothetical protein